MRSLRQMHEEGLISDAEYAETRSRMLASA